jgi:hypothetical protein
MMRTLADIGRSLPSDGRIADMAELLSQCNEIVDDPGPPAPAPLICRDEALRCRPGSREAKRWMFRAWRANEIGFGELVRYLLIRWRG